MVLTRCVGAIRHTESCLTLSTSSNIGCSVCFLTRVFRLPFLVLSGSKYVLTYLRKRTRQTVISWINHNSKQLQQRQ